MPIRCDEAVAIGDPLYVTGYNAGQNKITVAKADSSDANKMPAIGLAAATYAMNDNGDAAALGLLDDLDTSSFSVGDVVYVASGGGLTATKPVTPLLIQNVGKVARSHASQGEIVVSAIGRTNDVPNMAIGKFQIGTATNPAESAYTLPTSDGTVDQVLTTNGSGAVSFGYIPESLVIAASDETTALTTGTAKVTFRMPYKFRLTEVRASLTTAGTTSSLTTIDINESGTTILSTKITIDLTEKTSTTAATPPVISDVILADDAEITIDIDNISGGATEAGLKVYLIGFKYPI